MQRDQGINPVGPGPELVTKPTSLARPLLVKSILTPHVSTQVHAGILAISLVAVMSVIKKGYIGELGWYITKEQTQNYKFLTALEGDYRTKAWRE